MTLARRLAALCLLGLVTISPAGAQESGPAPVAALGEADYAAIVAGVIDGAVVPGFATLDEAAARFSGDVAAFCAAPDASGLAGLRGSFRETVLAFSAVEYLRFGPLLEDHRLERLAFWPDARGLGLRQVQGALAAADESAASAETLAGKSVAMQGVTALDFLLAGAGADDLAVPGAADFRCRYAAAAAANVAGIAGDLDAAWSDAASPARRLFAEPGPDNPMFQTSREAAGEIFKQVATGLEIVADHKLRTILGETPEKAKPRLAPFWRSGLTMASVRADVAGLRSVVAASGAAGRLPAELAWLGNAIDFEFANAERAAARLDAPIERVVSEPDLRALAGYLALTLSSLRAEVGSDLTGAIGLSKGFNSLDGD